MSNPYMGSGISQGLSNVAQHIRTAPEREARQREAEARATESEMRLQEFEEGADLRKQQRSVESAKLEADLYQTNATLAKQQSFDAFKMYDTDSDPRHLNNWLQQSKTNPVSKNITAGMTRLDRLTRTPETEQMLRGAGIKDLDGFFGDPNLTKSYVVGTTPDGQQTLVDMNRMYQATGYAQHTTDEARKNIAANAVLMQQVRAGANVADLKKSDALVTQIADATGVSRDEAYRLLREKPADAKSGPTSQLERVAGQLRKDNPDMSYEDSLEQAMTLTTRPSTERKPTNEAAFITQYQEANPDASYEEALTAYREAGRDERTSSQKNIEYSEEAKGELDKSFGGSFLDAGLTNLDSNQRAEMAKYVNRIEQTGGLQLSSEEKKNARSFRKLMGTAQTAGEGLTAEQTGPIDSMLRSVKSYIFDEVDGKDATAAYESFRAIARNALFGSQVSASDYKAFNRAFAGLEQQTGPILVSLKTQLDMMRDDMQAMADLNDPYVVKARFGVDLDKLDDIINAIDDRVDIIDRIQKGKPVPGIKMITDKESGSGIKVNAAPVGEKPDTGERPPLSSYFGG